MRDGVSPCVEGLESGLTVGVSAIVPGNDRPQAHPQPAEVGPQVTGVGVAVIELTALHEHRANDRAEDVGSDASGKEIDGLRVQVAAKALELGGKKLRVCVVHLQCRVPTASPGAAHSTMCGLEFVEGLLGAQVPAAKSGGRQDAPIRNAEPPVHLSRTG